MLESYGYDVLFSLWVGLFAPKGTPDAIVDKLRTESKKAADTVPPSLLPRNSIV